MTGRPPLFDETVRQRYLAHVATGLTLAEAAAATPIHHNVPPRHARTDPTFGRALADARAAGKKARVEDLAHDEYRYNCHGCRCDLCCTAARKGRAGRRAAAEQADEEGQSASPGRVHEIRPEPKSLPSFLLARAS